MSEEKAPEQQVESTDPSAQIDEYTQRALQSIRRTVVETLIHPEYMGKLAAMLLQSKSFMLFIKPIIRSTVQEILIEEREAQKKALEHEQQ